MRLHLADRPVYTNSLQSPCLYAHYFCIKSCRLFSATCLTDWQLNNCIHSATVSRDFTRNILLKRLPLRLNDLPLSRGFSASRNNFRRLYGYFCQNSVRRLSATAWSSRRGDVHSRCAGKEPITIAIRAPFEYDSSTIRAQHATTRYEVFRALAYEIDSSTPRESVVGVSCMLIDSSMHTIFTFYLYRPTLHRACKYARNCLYKRN